MSKDAQTGPAAVPGCIFCQIAAGRIPSIRVYEDDDFIAFMDIAPQTEGHFLIVSRAHYELLGQVPDALLARALPLAKKLSQAALRGLGVEAFNIIQNNGEAAGQAVGHWHLHLIPRRDKSEIPLKPGKPADLTRLPFVAENIRANLK
ncbi:MAG: HIT domain-containing protein [Candidatus Adiutrix sp.]|jgi:histidine triad (HIT) family protein|nr:HIT domain-containing protein [Candidatus Adiutrix sp.]